MARPDLLRRFPSRRTSRKHSAAIPVADRGPFPALAEDFAVLDEVVAEPFRELDLEALGHQYRYRRQQIGILLGSALLSGLAAVQAVLSTEVWPGAVVLLLGLLLGTSSRLAGELEMSANFLRARVRAERLRSLHFQFLARTGPYAGQDRVKALHLAVAEVKAGKEPT